MKEPASGYVTNAARYKAGRRLISDAMKILRPLVAQTAALDGPESARVLLDMAGTATHRTGLIYGLLKPDLVREAAILARTVFDLDVSATYIFDAPQGIRREHRVSRFLQFEKVQEQMLLKLLDPEGAKNAGHSDAAKQVFKDIADHHTLGWTGLPVSKLRQKIENKAERERLTWLMSVKFSFAFSAYVHPTPMGIRDRRGLKYDVFRRVIISAVPFIAVECLQHLTVLAVRAFGVVPRTHEDATNAIGEVRRLIERFAGWLAAHEPIETDWQWPQPRS